LDLSGTLSTHFPSVVLFWRDSSTRMEVWVLINSCAVESSWDQEGEDDKSNELHPKFTLGCLNSLHLRVVTLCVVHDSNWFLLKLL
jgi:hypothetical protein